MRKDQERKAQGLEVIVRNGNFESAFRKFKKKVQDEGIIQEFKERQEYTKPSVKRRRAKAAARSRHLKKVAKNQQERGY